MANQVTLTFAGDSKSLAKESKAAADAVTGVGKAATDASSDMANAAKSTEDYTSRVGKLGAAVTGASTAVDDATAAVSALASVQQSSIEKAARLARALNDVAQAQEDFNQAMLDGKQAAADAQQSQIDARQAALDARAAQVDYNDAVKEHGKNSIEAQQALIDLSQAQQDAKQATLDGEQATRDAAQSTIDAKAAQLDLNEAQREANPPDIQKWADDIERFTPILSGLISIVGLVTAAQWAWNAAQLASPLTWIILAIVALIAVIVLIATKTDWFQKAWTAAWGWIKGAASSAWNFIKQIPGWIGAAFSTVAKAITAPFRIAFNFISDAWNHTIGSLSWTVPGWVPFIGGNTISVPDLPKFHSGGVVPGLPGQEVLAVLQAGETVSPAGRGGGGVTLNVSTTGGTFEDAIAATFNKLVQQGRIIIRTA